MTACKTNKKTNKSTRTPQAEKPHEELKRLRLEMGFDKVSLSYHLGIPYRTLQDYESGRRGIPAKFASKMRAAHRADRAYMKDMARRVDRDIRSSYPRGIPSELILPDDDFT